MTLKQFLAQRSKSITKFTAKITNSFRTRFLSSMLLTALEHLERKTFRLLQILSTVIGRDLEKS